MVVILYERLGLFMKMDDPKIISVILGLNFDTKFRMILVKFD